ncbi:MAG: hypothetical protein OER97_03030 [Gammaproteobacteria bacterium]|nr:hypothetical protein [Gammaproteobacteria bacterium]
MNGETENAKDPDEIDDNVNSDGVGEDTVVIDSDDDEFVDNVGDLSVELNVEELVAKLEATDSEDSGRQREIKRRLEEKREQCESEKDLGSTYNFNLDEDI